MSKRSRPPGISDGAEASSPKSARTPAKLTASAKTCTPKSTKKTISTPLSNNKSTSKPIGSGKNRIICSLDFGTTFSGIAYAMTINSDARDVQVITDWTGGAKKTEQMEKVPSRIALTEENNGLENDCFGYNIEPGMEAHAHFKLHLDATAEHTEFDNPHLQHQYGQAFGKLPRGMTPVELSTRYLKLMFEKAMARFEKVYSKEVLKDSAVVATRDAAVGAGFGSRKEDDLFLITEPEAAAIAILSESIEKNPGLYKERTNVLVVDMGGGTVDIQCLTITSCDPLRTEETCEGTGGKSGSTYIDCCLLAWMEDTFGAAFTSLPQTKTAPNSKFMEAWETAKKSFTSRELRKVYRLSLPALKKMLEVQGTSPTSYDFDDQEVLITGVDIAAMFEGVIEKTFGLIDSQLRLLKKNKKSAFEVIALCGGLGSSEYIWTRLQKFCQEDLHGNVTVVTDERAWSAVVRGACARGMEGSMVLSKKAKRYYGIGVHQPFQEEVDKEENAYLCPIKGKRAVGYVDWVVKKGRSFRPGMRCTSKVYLSVELEDDEEDMSCEWDLYSCANDSAPNRIDGQGVKHEAKITIDISHAFKRQRLDDEGRAQAAEVNIVIKMGDEKCTLVVEGLHNRKVVGTAVLDYSQSHKRKPVRFAGLLN